MKEIFYRKVGRRYKPVSEYDSNFCDAFPKGAHLVVTVPGGRSIQYNIDPNYAAMIAAGRVAMEAMVDAMHAAELPHEPDGRRMTQAEIDAWNNLIAVWGESARTLTRGGVRTVVEAGINAMQTEADRLMQHESVRLAWDHFQTVCALAGSAND